MLKDSKFENQKKTNYEIRVCGQRGLPSSEAPLLAQSGNSIRPTQEPPK